MASSLFGQKSSDGGIQSRINQVVSAMKGDPESFGRSLMQSNPRFADFVKNNKAKSPEQIAREHGIDYGRISPFIR